MPSATAYQLLVKLKNAGYATNVDYLENCAHPTILNKATWDRLYGDSGEIFTSKSLRGWRGPFELQHRLASMLHLPFTDDDKAKLEGGEWLNDAEVEGVSPDHQRRRVE